MFGDGEWLAERTEEQWMRYVDWLESLADKKLAIVEFGAGLAVPTVRYECQRRGGKLIRVNPREPQAPVKAIDIPCGALEAITNIDALLSRA